MHMHYIHYQKEVDAESGLLLFMICSHKENYHHLTVTYELIELKPDALLQTGIEFYRYLRMSI